MSRERIGILGGTFDPIHRGHLRMADAALDEAHLDRVLVIPGGDPAYKHCETPAEDRWRMVSAACSGDSRLEPLRLEIDSQPPVSTVHTLRKLRERYPRAELFYIIGADAMMKLRGWYCFDQIIPLCGFLVCPRVSSMGLVSFHEEKKRLMAAGVRLRILKMEPLNVSSTELRIALSKGEASPLLDISVLEYCSCIGLYGVQARVPQAVQWLPGLFDALNPKRFAHSLSVAWTARYLAGLYRVNQQQAEQAGLLHDCAKCLPLREMQRIAEEHSLTKDPSILSSGALLHSAAGAWVARNQYGMADPDVLNAIAYHNTGFPGMSPLAMCVCLADFIEPLRDSFPLLEQVRALSEQSLERALLLSLEGTAEHVLSGGKFLHPRTQDTIAWLKTLPGVGSGK